MAYLHRSLRRTETLVILGLRAEEKLLARRAEAKSEWNWEAPTTTRWCRTVPCSKSCRSKSWSGQPRIGREALTSFKLRNRLRTQNLFRITANNFLNNNGFLLGPYISNLLNNSRRNNSLHILLLKNFFKIGSHRIQTTTIPHLTATT